MRAKKQVRSFMMQVIVNELNEYTRSVVTVVFWYYLCSKIILGWPATTKHFRELTESISDEIDQRSVDLSNEVDV